MARRRSNKKDEDEASKGDAAPSEAEESKAAEAPAEPEARAAEAPATETPEAKAPAAEEVKEKPKPKGRLTKGRSTKGLGDAPTFEAVKAFVKGGGKLPPALVSAEWPVEGGTMVKLKNLAAGCGHPKLVLPAKK